MPDKAAIHPHPISIEFFSKAHNKTTKLINNSVPDFSIEGQHRWYDYSFKQPAYLTEIRISSKGYANYDKFDLRVDHVDGTHHSERIAVSGDTITLALGKLCKSFSFRPERKWVTNTEILTVVATGLTLSEFHEYEWQIKESQKREEQLDAQEASISERELKILDQAEENKLLASEVGKLRGERDQLNASIKSVGEVLAEDESKLEEVKGTLEASRRERNQIRGEAEEQRLQLEVLTREVRLFPSEITGFVQEGTRNIKWYVALSLPFVAILVIVTHALFSGAADLSQLWKEEEQIEVWTIFLTRLPFVIIAFALIETCGYIVGRLIYEVVRINRQRLEFQKLSIIAKDVSAASAHGSGIDEETLFEEETKLKMVLLREYMQNQSNAEFEYRGSALISAFVGVANKLVSRGENLEK